MANIVINVDELICEAPVFVHTEWTGARYVFSIDWTSLGDVYFQFDPTIRMELSMEIYQNVNNPPTLEYSGVIDSNAPFNVTGYTFNVNDYTFNFSSKYDLYLTLKLISDASCNESTTYQLPIDYP